MSAASGSPHCKVRSDRSIAASRRSGGGCVIPPSWCRCIWRRYWWRCCSPAAGSGNRRTVVRGGMSRGVDHRRVHLRGYRRGRQQCGLRLPAADPAHRTRRGLQPWPTPSPLRQPAGTHQRRCVGCARPKQSTLGLHIRAVTKASALMLVTTMLLVVWLLAIAGDHSGGDPDPTTPTDNSHNGTNRCQRRWRQNTDGCVSPCSSGKQ